MQAMTTYIRRAIALVAILTTMLAAMPLAGMAQDPVDDQKARCKDGGWQTLTDANGDAFSNQGECVSYVATGGTFAETPIEPEPDPVMAIGFNGTVVDFGGGISGCDFSIDLTALDPNADYTLGFPFGYYHTSGGVVLYENRWQYFEIEFPMTFWIAEYDVPGSAATYTVPSCGTFDLTGT